MECGRSARGEGRFDGGCTTGGVRVLAKEVKLVDVVLVWEMD